MIRYGKGKKMENRTNEVTRRELFRQSLAAGSAIAIPAFVPATAVGRTGAAAPSERITLGVIGFGSRSRYNLGGILPHDDVRCLAVCDIQASRREAGKKLIDDHYGNRDCRTYRDLRELLERADIDAMLIGTGDNWHAPASILAARAGKDVYCEKPCGLTIHLCQTLDDTFRETGQLFQAGTQRRSVRNFVAAVDKVQAGRLGKLHTLTASVYMPSIETQWLPGEPTPPREQIDWDLWLGPAPWRPYNPAYVAGRWRGQWDFESGARLLDWGAHTVDLCQWANQADDTVPIEYEANGAQITARYANGVKLVLDCLATPFGERPGWTQELGTCPVRFEGEEGWIETGDSGGIRAQPASLQAELEEAIGPRISGLDVADHSRNFFDCMRSRQQPAANSQVMRRSHIACHAAALVWLLDRPLRMDPVRERFLDDDEANGLHVRPAREPWVF